MLGTTDPKSSSIRSVNVGSSDSSSCHSPCSRAYASTNSISSAERPENSRYRSVSASIGKIAQVEPNSGDMLPIVARSASGSRASPSP